MEHNQLAENIHQYLYESYPNISIKVEPWNDDPSRIAIYFIEEKFNTLYPLQRYHYLIHLLPEDFFDRYLKNSVWFELAPNEKPEDLVYPDNELINDISEDVFNALNSVDFFSSLDNIMAPIDSSVTAKECQGDFELTKKILIEKGFRNEGNIDEIFDICHVLMNHGGYCDCEILTNVIEGSNFNKIKMNNLIREIDSQQQ